MPALRRGLICRLSPSVAITLWSVSSFFAAAFLDRQVRFLLPFDQAGKLLRGHARTLRDFAELVGRSDYLADGCFAQPADTLERMNRFYTLGGIGGCIFAAGMK